MRPTIPWRIKLIAKLALSRLPVPYGTWKALDLFGHGQMDQEEYATGVFQQHFRVGAPNPPFSVLELGPGDSLASALIAKAYGACATWLVDSGPFATRDPKFYQRLARHLERLSLPVPTGWSSCEDMLRACGSLYLTDGLCSLKTIPDNSVDFIWSHAVLEHVRRHEFRETLQEFRRIIKNGGIMSHQIDLTDHLGGGLHNLRFPPEKWESEAWVKAGFYTNRLRYSEIRDELQSAGFTVEPLRIQRWDQLPLARRDMDAMFRHLGDEDLCVFACSILCRPVPLAAEHRSGGIGV